MSDGTTAGTRVLKDMKDVPPGVKEYSLAEMTLVGERLLFFVSVKDTKTSTWRGELWTSDGTTSGTMRLLDGLPLDTKVLSETKLGGALVFQTHDENSRVYAMADDLVFFSAYQEKTCPHEKSRSDWRERR